MANNHIQSVSNNKGDLKVEAKEKETGKTSQSGGFGSSSAYPAHKGEQLESLYKIAILGIIIAIIMLAFDILRDNNLYGKIAEMEKQIMRCEIEELQKEIIDQQNAKKIIETERNDKKEKSK